jgi:hypothetical protein
MEWLVVKRAWRGAAGLVAWRRLFFVALAGMVVAGARVVVDGVVILIFAGWLPQDGASAGAVIAGLEASVAPCGAAHS